MLAESDLSGTITYEYIYFNGQRIARRDPGSGNVYYFLGDRLGSARMMTNATGGVVEESDYYPYGGERVITDTLDNNYKFTGHERDGESGLDHTLHRQYASNLGRWHSPDPKHGKPSDPQTWNRYSYVAGKPRAAHDWVVEAIFAILAFRKAMESSSEPWLDLSGHYAASNFLIHSRSGLLSAVRKTGGLDTGC